MAKINKLRQDSDALEGGRWFPWKEDIELLIRPLGSDDYQERLRELQKPHERLIRAAPDSDMAREITRKCVRQAIAEKVLIGWRNIQGEDGQDIPYSPEQALEFFLDPTMAHLYRAVITSASDEDSYMAVEEDADLGNFGGTSPGI